MTKKCAYRGKVVDNMGKSTKLYGGARAARIVLCVLVVLLIALLGCRKKGDSIVLAGDGTRLSSDEIDRDPFALLPGGVIGLGTINTKVALQSELGAASRNLIQALIPLGPEANFDVGRDVEKVLIGLYSMQGADVAIIVQGSLDPEAIRNAAMSGKPNAFGQTLTRVEYANNDVFVSGDVGFVVVTKRTMIAGNEAGMRRALDRIRDKRVHREVPDWMLDFVQEPKASIALVGDLSTDPVVRGASHKLPFVNGLTLVRVLGNFESPGLNLAGTMSYPDMESANRAVPAFEQLGQLASFARLLSLIGIQPPIQDMQVKADGQDVKFVAAVNVQGATAIMNWGASMLRK